MSVHVCNLLVYEPNRQRSRPGTAAVEVVVAMIDNARERQLRRRSSLCALVVFVVCRHGVKPRLGLLAASIAPLNIHKRGQTACQQLNNSCQSLCNDHCNRIPAVQVNPALLLKLDLVMCHSKPV